MIRDFSFKYIVQRISKDDKYELLFLLACLNSTFIKNYWKSKYSDTKALFQRLRFSAKELPFNSYKRTTNGYCRNCRENFGG